MRNSSERKCHTAEVVVRLERVAVRQAGFQKEIENGPHSAARRNGLELKIAFIV